MQSEPRCWLIDLMNQPTSLGLLVARIDLKRFCTAVLVLSETVLVLVIESNLWRCYVRSTHDLLWNATKLLSLSENESLNEHER